MQLKVTASEIFKDQKDSYPQSIGRLFLDSRLGMWIYASVASVLNDGIVPGNTEPTKVSLVLLIEREQINLKVAQTLGNDKVQVGFLFPCQT